MNTKGNPKDSIKSTWRQGDRGQWTFAHWFLHLADPEPKDVNKKAPVHSKNDAVPHLPGWYFHRWILFHACIPLVIHHAYVTYMGRNLGFIEALFFYSAALKLIGVREVKILRRLGYLYGFFDGDKHERDDVPDVSVKKVYFSLTVASWIRPIMAVILTYNTAKVPSSINWIYLPLEVTVYSLAVDLWFYWYHRMMHDVDSLWKFHRTHHLTKHPNPLLSLYADGVQEAFDVVIIPLLAFSTLKFAGLPMGFYEMWICNQYLIFTEALGHSGLRVYAIAPSPLSWLYQFLGVEGVIEDHDLHHRQGWKSSHSYGKHSAIWDNLFGTSGDRIECKKGNIDFENTASFPLF